MNATPSESTARRLRLLVVIASFGTKNLELLRRIIRNYQNLSMATDIVVVSEAPKELGPQVKVLVGLPTSDPWSLPFAHKPVFAQEVEHYDLFAYSEDDMDVTENNLQAFLRATPQLAPDEIAGYLRYEEDKAGDWSLPDAHGPFHWKPESVAQRGECTVAEFTNEHAAFYLLTQAQLKRAIASGGLLSGPRQGRYDMACTAATDPYTSCGFRKVICISALKDFLIHHASNRYAGQLGTPLSVVEQQVQTQMAIAKGAHPATTLCQAESGLLRGRWSKSYYEQPSEDLLELVPANAKQILSIGCGSGATEAALKQRGAQVFAAPLDSIIGADAARRGIDIVYGSLSDCFRTLEGRKFDCVLMTNLLHLLPNPKQVLRQCSDLVAPGGAFVLSGPNFNSLRLLAKRALGSGDYRKLRAFDEGGINVLGPSIVAGALKDSRLRVSVVRWPNGASTGQANGLEIPLSRFKAESWIFQARWQAH
jgi:2-polyprenyl-3-methyl-5-hydroxy-6-metoxy-1,4-benzoquinol methylase